MGIQDRKTMMFLGIAIVTLATACFTPAFGMQECRADEDCGRWEICNCAWDDQRRECRNLGFCVECREDRNCRTGERGSSSGVCVKDQRKAFVGKPCRFNSDCPAPASRASSGGFIGSLSKFLSCDRKTGRCPECDFDFDCPGKSCKSGNCVRDLQKVTAGSEARAR